MSPRPQSLNSAPHHQEAVNAIRFLAMDAIQKANSGHPGAPMGLAPAAFVLYRYFLKHNPKNPKWYNRDRCILSAGHASMLLYATLHLAGYKISMDDIKNFRQWESITPGHPELHITPGVETTTGPLGQGFANAVGIAMAERMTAHTYNRPNHNLIDHRTYIIASDGDMEEGVACEAASLAGTWRLNKLICLYDDNGITIDGSADLHLREDVSARFRAYGWNTIERVDGTDLDAIADALQQAQQSDRPVLIPIKTTIGHGSPNKSGSEDTHGAPLGEEEIALTRAALNWEHPPFVVPEEVYNLTRGSIASGSTQEGIWNQAVQKYQDEFLTDWHTLQNDILNQFSDEFQQTMDKLRKDSNHKIATRAASGQVLNQVTKVLPRLAGGSADLAEANHSIVHHRTPFQDENPQGRNFYFGVREHAMGAISNGLALHGEFIPYAATFLIFSDYMRNAIRMSALNELQVIWVLTHDSIGLGEDGPTHQPISQLMGLRMIPNLVVIRPADYSETVSAWELALRNTNSPTAIILSRQAVTPIASLGGTTSYQDVAKGAYIAKDTKGTPDIILIATGSEVELAINSADILTKEGVSTRVVSMPSWELFAQQDQEYQSQILPPQITNRISIEAGTTIGWERYATTSGITIGIDHFGASAPAEVLFHKFGFNTQNVVAKAHSLLNAK